MTNKYKNTSKKGKSAVEYRWLKVHKEVLDYIKSNNSERHMELKSRICGHLAGDGYVAVITNKKGNKTYEIYFYPDDKSMAKSYLDAFKIVYNKNLKLKKRRNENTHIISIRNKPICLDLLSIMSFKSLTWNVPFKFLSTQKRKIEWLRAFFDAEAHVAKNQIQVQSVNKTGLEGVQKLLLGFEVESRIYSYQRKQKKWNTNYILCIMRRENRVNFLKYIGFNHKIKLQRLKQFLSQNGGTVNALVSNRTKG